MDEYVLYENVDFAGCRADTSFDLETITAVQKVCAPLGSFKAQGKCINDFKTDKTCDYFEISSQVEAINGTRFQCFTQYDSRDIDF